MSTTGIFEDRAVMALGWTLVHFLWQGIAAAALLLAARQCLRLRSANARYLAACCTMVIMVISPVLTFGTLLKHPEPKPSAAASIATASPRAEPTGSDAPVAPLQWNRSSPIGESHQMWIDEALPWLVRIWMTAVVLLSLRLLAGSLQVSRIRRKATPLSNEFWSATLARLAQTLNIRPSVQVLQSAWVEVPTVVGWLRPAILFPATTLSGLTPEQLETILAHELAHIRRHDFLVNVLQSLVETALFYHPAVWWVSRQIRQEREHCCDDLAIEACGDRITYARALATLEELRSLPLPYGVTATGGSLLHRIRRILTPQPQSNRSDWWISTALTFTIALSAGSLISNAPSIAAGQQENAATQPAKSAAIEPAPSTPPQLTIEVKLAELSAADAKNLELDWFLNTRSDPAPQGAPATFTGLQSDPQFRDRLTNTTHIVGAVTGTMTERQFRAIIQKLETRKDVSVLSSPKVTTLSGRQARVDATELKTIVYDKQIKPGETKSKDVEIFQTTQARVGTMVDVTPRVSTDGGSVQLILSAQLLEFVGYDEPKPGDEFPKPLPRFRNRQASTTMVVPNGQTLVLGGMPAGDKQLVIFVTPFVIDPAGNRKSVSP